MITNLNRFTPDQILTEYNNYLVSNGIKDTLENFSNYLLQKNWSTAHAKDVYNFICNGNFEDLTQIDDIKLRKSHPNRDRAIKRGGVSAVLAGGAIWGLLSLLSIAIAAGQTHLLGTEILSDATANNINFISTAVCGSLGVFFGGIAIKNWGTKSYYNKKYGADRTLKQLEKGKELEKTKLAKLIKAINKDNEKIYNLREGLFITKPFRFVRRHILNITNRNRMHQFAKTFEDLLEKYYVKMSDQGPTNEQKYNDTTLKNIVKLLEMLDNAYSADITTSKLFTLLNCKEDKKHNHTIESLDIWSKLAMLSDAAERVGQLTADVKKEVKKDYKDMKKDQEVYNTARRLFNQNPNLLNKGVLNNYYSLKNPTMEFVFPEQTNNQEVTNELNNNIEELLNPVQPIIEETPITEEETIILPTEEPVVEENNNEKSEEEFTIPETLVNFEEIPVSEEADKSNIPYPEADASLKHTLQRLQAKVKVDELTRGNKVTISNMQDNTKETIKVTYTPAGTKINVEVKKADGSIIKTSHRSNVNSVDSEVKRILQENALNSGVDLEQLNLL